MDENSLNMENKLEKEFDCQVANLLQKGYPAEAGMSQKKFADYLGSLREKLKNLKNKKRDLEFGRLPFIIVVKSGLVDASIMMSLVERQKKRGITKLFPLHPPDFNPIDPAAIPPKMAYLLIDIDRGKKNINLPPSEALKKIEEEKRLPLTIDEGIAIVTQYPDFLAKNNCFSLLASRHMPDKRVPAIWINTKKEPNLGWCWEGNPHTWLGSASAAARIG